MIKHFLYRIFALLFIIFGFISILIWLPVEILIWIFTGYDLIDNTTVWFDSTFTYLIYKSKE